MRGNSKYYSVINFLVDGWDVKEVNDREDTVIATFYDYMTMKDYVEYMIDKYDDQYKGGE